MMILGRPGVSAFVGVGDVQGSAAVYFGLDAYTGAIAATGTQKSVKLRRASDDTTQDIVILTTGIVDVASAVVFAGVDATGNATSSGTTVALTGLSGAAHVGDTIVGAGFVGTYCVSVGALVAGAQTVTTNTSQSIAVSEPVTLLWGLYVDTLYDQIGTNHLTQATKANQPQFLPDGGPSSGVPSMEFQGNQWVFGGSVNASQPVTAMATAIRKAAFTSFNVPFQLGAGGSTIFSLSFTSSANTAAMFAGTVLSATAADSTWHVLQGVGNGGSSAVQVDATNTTGNAGAGSGTGQALVIGTNATGGGTDKMNGSLVNACFWLLNVGVTPRTAVSAQVHSNWGF